MSRHGRAREQHDIDPVLLPENVDVGRGRDRVVCIRLDDLRTSIPQLVREALLTDAIAGALGDVCGRTIFLPRSRIARKGLADELRDRGAQVIEADAYDAIPTAPDIDVLRETDRIDVVLLTSASAATHLMDLLPKDVRDRLIKEAEAACIGPVTAQAARSLGFRVCAVARNHTVDGLVESLEEVRANG